MLILLPSVNAIVYYNITIQNRDAILNITFTLHSDVKYDIWQINWELPQKSQIISIKDEKGHISDYSINNGMLFFETNPYKSNERTINLNLLVKNAVSDEFAPLYKLELFLPSFKGEETIVHVYLPHIISGDVSYGFKEYYEENFAQFTGKESLELNLFYSFSGKEYKNFVLFGSGDLRQADELFSLVKNVTGANIPFKKFPVFVMNDEDFEAKIKYWGTAVHMKGGIIIIKESAMNSPFNASIILHEVTHGFNAKALKWSQTNITWFDEGISSFMEYLVNDKLNLRQGQLFGETVYFNENGKKISIKPKGNKEELWRYYYNRDNFMLSWNTDNPSTRDFGYAFSELVIRDVVKKNGINKIKEAYKDFKKINHTVTDINEFNDIVLGALDSNFRPCYYLEKTKFEECLKQINEQKIILPGFNDNVIEKNVVVTPSFNNTLINNTFESSNYLESSFKEKLISLLETIINFLNKLFH